MKARKICLQEHTDALVGSTVETKAMIVGAVSVGGPQSPMTVDDMRLGAAILDAVEESNGAGSVCLPEVQWAFLKKKIETAPFTIGNRAMLSAIDDVLDAEKVDMSESVSEKKA